MKVLTVRKADRQKDKGVYKIRLTCEGGNFEATGFVNVLDVPSRPRLLRPDEVGIEILEIFQDENEIFPDPSRAREAELGAARG